MKALVVGAGQMGMAIAYAMRKLAFDVVVVDVFPDLLEKAQKKLESLDQKCEYSLLKDIFIIKEVDFDVCISAAPFNSNKTWAKWCKERKVPYCDLGGNKDVSDSIHQISIELNPHIPVFTDLGLAPGYINILTENIYKEFLKYGEPQDIYLRCGGLPIDVDISPLNYALVFSVQGLVNEYMGNCQTLSDGKSQEVGALTGLEGLKTKHGKFEAFNTSGGLSTLFESMQKKGVKNLNYKTIRYPGHYAQLKKRKTPSLLEFFKDCPKTTEDMVVIRILAQNNDYILINDIKITHSQDWTAMQQGTAFPAAAVAAIMAEKAWNKPVLTYEDMPFDIFSKKLNIIGMNEEFSLEVRKTSLFKRLYNRIFK
ncbi:MAG: hypothetical protein DWQ19_09925 [Crenarchaeota archaeon]|nr:MAG: hypothetical protein DWQ19_09925 [Thermoproteota archaeon]